MLPPARLPHWHSRLCLCLLPVLLLFGQVVAAEKPASSSATSAVHAQESEYQKIADQCHRLLRTPSLGSRREDWLQHLNGLERLYQQNPQGRTASASLYLSARMRQAMHQRFHQRADLDQATALFSNVVSLYPKSAEAAESLFDLAHIEQSSGNLRAAARTYYRLLHGYPLSSRKAQAQAQLRQLTMIAESLAARKEGRATGPVLTPKPTSRPAVVPAVKEAAKPVLKPVVSTLPAEKEPVVLPPIRVPEPAAPVQPASAQPVQTAAASLPTPWPEKKAQANLVLPLPEVSSKPVSVKPVSQNEGSEKKEDDSLLARLSFPDFSLPFFGSNEKKKQETTKPAPPVPSTPPAKESEPTAKIVVSELKIAALEPEPPPVKLITPERRRRASVPLITQTLPGKAELLPPLIQLITPERRPRAIVPLITMPLPAKAELLPPQIRREAVQIQPAPAPVPAAAAQSEPGKPALAELLPIQHWSSESYSRVAVSTSAQAVYRAELPSADSRKLRLEFQRSHVSPALRAPLAVDKGLIKTIRAEQTDGETVRVSLDLADEAECKIFSLNDPFRVVIDLHKTAIAAVKPAAQGGQQAQAAPKQEEKAASVGAQISIRPAAESRGLTLAQQLGLGIRRIMIDPGHGGKDTGATGFGLEEKDIVLDVAKRVRRLLQKEQYEALLTREHDVFLPLEERTALANTKGADLFLSIHVNAHPKASVKGVETYYLNLAADQDAMRVAALENATSSRSMSEMQDILSSLMKNTKIDESSLLAECIQTSMYEGLRRYKIKNLGVKKAPFYVLIGAQMPAVLAEISFISNKEEAGRLKDDQYLQAVAKQIAVGVVAYIEHRRTEAAAVLRQQGQAGSGIN